VGAFEWDLGTNELTWAAKVPTFTEVSDSDDFAGYLQYVDEADRSAVVGKMQRILDGGQHSVEVRIHPPDGRSLWFYFRAEAVFDGEGKPRRVYGVAMDVTERKQADTALRLSEKLAATGRLAATIAHEINNPLEAVTNLLFLARNSEDAGRETRGYLAQAEAELQRVAAIVRQTLGFYRGTTGPANLDLTAMVRESLGMLERRFAGNGIRLVEAMEGVTVRANEGEVRQVVMNLIANALDAVERGGTVWVEVKAAQGEARLEVRDDGKGISAGDMERLFEPFFTTKQGVGTGLGLWVSRELARKNGGGIEAASDGEGRGASFVLTLPPG
jgi:signal transduction histidine kinase